MVPRAAARLSLRISVGNSGVSNFGPIASEVIMRLTGIAASQPGEAIEKEGDERTGPPSREDVESGRSARGACALRDKEEAASADLRPIVGGRPKGSIRVEGKDESQRQAMAKRHETVSSGNAGGPWHVRGGDCST
jgi:hypothetical protein